MNDTAGEPRIAIATCAAFPELTPDDELLSAALTAAGARAVPAVWDDEGVAWEEFDACLVRSVWDYHFKLGRFLAWAERAAGQTALWNPAEQLAWNADKSYLRRLAERGVPTIPTAWVERGSEARLAGLLAERGWAEAVVKPTVDLGALNLRRVSGTGIDQIAMEGLLVHHDVMVQPFLPAVEEHGESSLVYVAGELRHAVRKRPRDGDFRVQPSWGGTTGAVEPTPSEQGVALAALAALLFLAEHPATADALAAATLRQLRMR